MWERLAPPDNAFADLTLQVVNLRKAGQHSPWLWPRWFFIAVYLLTSILEKAVTGFSPGIRLMGGEKRKGVQRPIRFTFDDSVEHGREGGPEGSEVLSLQTEGGHVFGTGVR